MLPLHCTLGNKWNILRTIKHIHFHSRAASQPRNLGDCHTLIKLIRDNCTQINNFISKMLLGLGKDKNPVLNAVYWIKNFNSLLHLLVCFLKSSFLLFALVYYCFVLNTILTLKYWKEIQWIFLKCCLLLFPLTKGSDSETYYSDLCQVDYYVSC